VERLRIVILALNIFIAAFSIINLSTLALDAIQVDVPDENDFGWIVDTKQGGTTFTADFTVTNFGIYDIYDLDIHAILLNESQEVLLEYEQNDLTIRTGEVKIFYINAFLPFEVLDLNELLYLLTHDSIFYLDVNIHANFMWGLSEFNVDETLTQPWEAPLKKTVDSYENETLADEILERLPPGSGLLDAVARAGLVTLIESLEENGIHGENWVLYMESPASEGDTSTITGYAEFDVFITHKGRMDFSMEVTETEEGYSVDLKEVNFDVDRI
jgi:hypothetical protein